MSENNVEKELALETIITNAIQIPGVKVNRDKFLAWIEQKRLEPVPEMAEEVTKEMAEE